MIEKSLLQFGRVRERSGGFIKQLAPKCEGGTVCVCVCVSVSVCVCVCGVCECKLYLSTRIQKQCY